MIKKYEKLKKYWVKHKIFQKNIHNVIKILKVRLNYSIDFENAKYQTKLTNHAEEELNLR